MPVYVDDAFIPYRNMLMCHMNADTREELIDMVDKIGVQRKWIQYPGQPEEHFDISKPKRELAIKYGAIPIGRFQLGRVIFNKMVMKAQDPEPVVFPIALELKVAKVKDWGKRKQLLIILNKSYGR